MISAAFDPGPVAAQAIVRDRCPLAFFEALEAAPTGPVLDIGCGSGVILRTMDRLGRPVVGIDIAERAVDLCRRIAHNLSGGHVFEVADARRFAIEEGRYAAIVAMTSLVAVRREELLALIDRIKAGLAPGGVLYIETFTTRDPMNAEPDKVMPPGETTFWHPRWNGFLHFVRPGELLWRFREFELVDYREVWRWDAGPVPHRHHEARLCCRKPAQGLGRTIVLSQK